MKVVLRYLLCAFILINNASAQNSENMANQQEPKSIVDSSINQVEQNSENDLTQESLVKDVLERDIREALRNSQDKNNSLSVTPQSILAPKLVALYGVGKALVAEIHVGNKAYLYVRGQTYPAGYLNDKRVYQLKAMNGACVQLEKGQDRHSLCLRMLLGDSTYVD